MGRDGGRFLLLHINQILPQTQKDAYHTPPDEPHVTMVPLLTSSIIQGSLQNGGLNLETLMHACY